MDLLVSPGTTLYFICCNFTRLFMFHFIWANLSPSQLACWALRNRCMWSLTDAWQTWLVPFQHWVILPHLLPFWSLSTLSYHRATVDQWRFHRESSYIYREKKNVWKSFICLLFPKRPPPVSQCLLMETVNWFWSIRISSLNQIQLSEQAWYDLLLSIKCFFLSL